MPHDLINAKQSRRWSRSTSAPRSCRSSWTRPTRVRVTHKRRLSALGRGGLTRERAGFEVRDVHTTHYGRICPIESRKVRNIGLIASLSTYARSMSSAHRDALPQESPRVAPRRGRLLLGLQEEGHFIAQSNSPIDKKGKFTAEMILSRHNGENVMCKPEEVTLMDVLPNHVGVGGRLADSLLGK